MVARSLRCVLGMWVVLHGASVYSQNVLPPTVNEYVYALPPAWTATPYPDGLVLMSPPSATNERCVFTVWPMRPSGTNLLRDASSAFQEIYRQYEPRNLTVRGTPMPSTVARGMSGQGWEYVLVKRGVAPPGSPESRLAFVLAIKLRDRLAVISGVSRDPLVSTCMGELAGNVWPRFFYSLSFRGWTPTDQSDAMRQKMAGTWTAATGTAATQFVFAVDGRYSDAAATRRPRTTQAYFGSGAYTLRGNAISLTPDGERPETGFVRVEDESTDEGRTWTPVLYLLRVSAVDGRDYEVRYLK